MKQTMQPISKLIKDFRKTLGAKRIKEQENLARVWEKIVGASVASHTKIAGVKQKVLYVKVNSSTILAELANFRKKKILQKLRAYCPTQTYCDINFIVGGW